MKKYFYALLALLVVAVSCKKPEPEPIIPDEPTGYADYIFQYEVNLPADASNYSYVELDLASVKGVDAKGNKADIWECFGLNSQAELIAALGELSGGAQTGQTVNFIGFDVSTEYQVETPSSTNGFGHWHMANGDCCNWGDDAYLFAEGFFVSNENLVMNIGQFPGRLEEGKTYKIIEGMADDETTAAFEITVNVKPQTEWVSYVAISVGGDAVEADFDLPAIANYLGYADAPALVKGIASGAVKVVPLNADGSEGECTQATDNDGNYYCYGAFYTVDGNVTTWNSGSDAVYFDCYGNVSEGWYGLDITPFTNLTEEHVSNANRFFSVALKAGDKVATLTYGYVVESAKPFADYTYENYTYNIRIMANDAYKSLVIPMPISLSEVLGLEAEWSLETLNVIGLNADESEYKNADGEYATTAGGVRGWWYSTEGNVCSWSGEAGPFAFAETDDLVNYRVGLHPTVAAGTEGTIKFKYVAGDKSQVITMNVKAVESL